MKNNNATKLTAVALSLALAVTAMPMPVHAAPAMPDFVKNFTPSESLGFVDSYFQGSTHKPVILIQDLHANYGVQKKITGLLEFLQPKVAPTGRPMVVGIEAAWGEINMANVRSVKEKTRQLASDFLLKEAEITAPEHFAAMSDSDVRLVGIDDPENYTVHLNIFRKSLAARLALAKKTDQLRASINDAKLTGPSELRRLWALEDALHEGRIDLNSLSKKLGVTVTNYRQAEEALATAKAAYVKEQDGKNAGFIANLVVADQNLSLLGRLLRQQLTFEEVQYASKRIPEMLSTVRAFIPQDNLSLWSDAIRAAIDYYAVALVRDTPMAKSSLELARANSDTSVVIVAGGFHAAGIVNFLKERKVSHIVLAPVVESHTAKDEELYVQRMMDIHVTEADLIASLPTSPQTQSLGAPGTYARAGMPTQGAVVAGKQFPRGRTLESVVQWIQNRTGLSQPTKAEVNAAADLEGAVAKAELPTGFLARFRVRLSRILPKAPETMEIPVDTVAEVVAKPTVNAPTRLGKPGQILTVAGVASLGVASISKASELASQSSTLVALSNPFVNSSASDVALVAGAVVATALGVRAIVKRVRGRNKIDKGPDDPAALMDKAKREAFGGAA